MVQFKFNLEAWSNSCSFLILNLHACGPRQLKLLSRGTHGNSSTVGLMIAYLIYPPGNDRWKYYLKWYITAPWASFIAFFFIATGGVLTLQNLSICGNGSWAYNTEWILSNSFPPCPPSCGKLNPFHTDFGARAIVWSILSCLARHGPDARSLQVCQGHRHIIAQVRRS